MDCTKIIGEKIKALRTAQEITLEELAERTGLSKEHTFTGSTRKNRTGIGSTSRNLPRRPAQ